MYGGREEGERRRLQGSLMNGSLRYKPGYTIRIQNPFFLVFWFANRNDPGVKNY